MENVQTNKLIITGTVHLGEDGAAAYIKQVHLLLMQLRPDIICAELTPEQAEGRATIDSKPEYHGAIIPAAEELGVRIIPIQPDEAVGAEIEQRQRTALEKIQKAPDKVTVWRMWETFAERVAAGVSTIVEQSDGLALLQSFELDSLVFEPWWNGIRDEFPEFYDSWEDFNRLMLERILDVVQQHPQKRIVLSIGLAHRYWMRRHLAAAGVCIVKPGE